MMRKRIGLRTGWCVVVSGVVSLCAVVEVSAGSVGCGGAERLRGMGDGVAVGAVVGRLRAAMEGWKDWGGKGNEVVMEVGGGGVMWSGDVGLEGWRMGWRRCGEEGGWLVREGVACLAFLDQPPPGK